MVMAPDDDDGMDPQYRMFLQNLMVSGKSYVYSSEAGDDGLPVQIEYEYGVTGSQDSNTQTSSCLTSSDGNDNSVPKISTPSPQQDSERAAKLAKLAEVSKSLSIPNNLDDLLDADDEYLTFLSLMTVTDKGKITLKIPSCDDIMYENLEAADNLAIEDQAIVPYTVATQVVDLTVDEDKSDDSNDDSETNEFKRELKANTNRPYDQKEYDRLWKEASERKPLEKLKHLRNMSISYATNEDGLSYLDHYPELAKQIFATEDYYKRLKLLRGLFFWLKNLCREGASIPWLSR